MTKLDWEKEQRRQLVQKQGATRAEVTRFRHVPPSDKQIDELLALGHRGKRPATSADAAKLIRELKEPRNNPPTRARSRTGLGVTEHQLQVLSSLPPDVRRARVASYLRTARETYDASKLQISRGKQKTSVKAAKLRELFLDHERLKRELEAVL